jgi:polysaccharide export outer membrane protein
MAAPKPTPSARISGGVPVDNLTYVIGAEDILTILVWEQPSLTCQGCLVRPDGNISMPFLNEVKAAGRTPDELRKDVADRLTECCIKNPQVSVQLSQIHSKKYFIQGEVNRPGESDLIVPTTIMEGLVAAGGFRDFADQKNIIIIRGSQRLRFNYRDVLKGKNLRQNVYLEPGDIIVVK